MILFMILLLISISSFDIVQKLSYRLLIFVFFPISRLVIHPIPSMIVCVRAHIKRRYVGLVNALFNCLIQHIPRWCSAVSSSDVIGQTSRVTVWNQTTKRIGSVQSVVKQMNRTLFLVSRIRWLKYRPKVTRNYRSSTGELILYGTKYDSLIKGNSSMCV